MGKSHKTAVRLVLLRGSALDVLIAGASIDLGAFKFGL